MKKLMYIYGLLIVRPRRWFFWKMIINDRPRFIFRHCNIMKVLYWPNIHWYLLYITVFKFFKWLYWDAWRYFCKWENGFLSHKPLISRVIQWAGRTTAGYTISGGECFNCGFAEGDQVQLSQDETGKTFILDKTWTEATPDGTDYCYSGITICPVCGYKSEFKDGSL